jgi:hypothetical protein
MQLSRAGIAGRWLLALLVVLTFWASAWAQQTSATLSGVVKDAQGALVPNAKVVVTNQEQGAVVRELTTASDGSFTIFPLNPGIYLLTVEAAGFRKFEQRDLRIFASDRINLTNIALQVGAVSETVEVAAQYVQLETQTAMRSGVITGNQTANIALNGRSYMDLVRTIPGVVMNLNAFASGGVTGPGAIQVNGQRSSYNTLTLDGVTNMDTGNNSTQHTALNVDSVAEFRVVANSQSAEFGRSAGAAINVVTKGGTRDFHGTGYFFHRHEGMNANNWRNNIDNIPRNLYRYNFQGYNIGGPIYIPGKFNQNRDKLFFFWAQEWQEQLRPNTARNVTMPTEAERKGDFSLTHESDGRLVTIKDPLTGLAFPGNQIPQNRWNSDGAKILNWYPLPNYPGRPDYNYTSSQSTNYPRRQIMGRVDWNINDKWRLFIRAVRDKDYRLEPYGWSSVVVSNMPFMSYVGFPGNSTVANLTTVINPTLTNEFIFGVSWNHVYVRTEPDISPKYYKKDLGLSYQMPFPTADALQVVQSWSWGGVSNGPSVNLAGNPFVNMNTIFEATDNLSKVYNSHMLKFGIFLHRQRKNQTAFSPVNGNISFARDSTNPTDSNWAYSNALLGNYTTVQQADIIRNGKYRYTNAEWYVADTWKVRPNLTLDLGIRFYIVQPQYDAGMQLSSFDKDLWGTNKVALLYQRARNPQGAIVAQDPITGAYYPSAFIGGLVTGTGYRLGDAYINGIAMAGVNDYPRGLINSRGLHYAPRVGIAWNFMNKTVFRTGAGVFYDRFQGNPCYAMLTNPPATVTPTLYYGSLTNIASATSMMFPGTIRGFSRDGHVSTVVNWNAGIQRELPFQMLLDAAYVGSIGRHGLSGFDVNRPGFGSAWLPQNQDPTVTPKYDGTTTLPVNFYRPYQGHGSINTYTFGSSSNYNALQVSLNRRLGAGLQAGVAYAWSKSLGTGTGDADAMHPTNTRGAMYGPLSNDRRHNLVLNYIYNTPRLAKSGNVLDNWLGKAVFNDWTVSGITTLQTGSPDSVSYSISGISDLARRVTGDETWNPRVILTGQAPAISKDKRNEYSWYNAGAFAPAVKPSVGMESAVRGYIYGPGTNNWDFSVFKKFVFSSDGARYVQLRLEMFNAPNHTQFSSTNNSIIFDAAGKVTNLPTALGGGGGRFGFGTVTGARDPRILQIAAKIYF